MRILLRNLTIIPMTKDGYVLHGDMGIENGRIAFIGSDPAFSADSVRDCTGLTALPSFINAHTHLSMTLMRNYKDTSPDLQQWLGEIFPIEAKLNDEAVYWGSMAGAAELIKGGCTVFADMYYHQAATVRAAREAGIRGIIGLTMVGDIKAIGNSLTAQLREIEAEAGNDDMFRIDPAVHAIYTCTPATYAYARDMAIERGSYLNTHLSETRKEMEDCLSSNGCLPAQLLERNGVFEAKCYLAHGVHLQDEELRIISEHGASVVHNPSSNMKLHSGIAPISHFRDMGVNLALGTDGASSNNNLSMLKELNLAALLNRLSSSEPFTPYEILRMATADGAKALGLEELGTLEKGKAADFILFDTSTASMSPVNDIFSALVYSADRENIESVWCNGRQLTERGRLLTLDEAVIVREHKRVWKELLER